MGSSSASETTINTSTDSANTMVTMVTTTDGEQQDDSFDLVDIPSELSAPSGTSQSQTSLHRVSSTKINSSQIEANPRNIEDKEPNTAHETQPPISNVSSAVENPNVPPPTPLVGVHQASKFTFGSGRTPPLPDLKATDFFSTPVRGSMDAGQADANQLNAAAILLAAKERQNAKSGSQAERSKHSQKRPNINVTTNPLDISLIGNERPCNGQPSTCARNRGKSTDIERIRPVMLR